MNMNDEVYVAQDDDLFFDISVVDKQSEKRILSDDSSRYIIESLMNYPPAEKQKDKAIRILIWYLSYHGICGEKINVSYIERERAPPVKEMTVKEIEERLGYKIKIVKEK